MIFVIAIFIIVTVLMIVAYDAYKATCKIEPSKPVDTNTIAPIVTPITNANTLGATFFIKLKQLNLHQELTQTQIDNYNLIYKTAQSMIKDNFLLSISYIFATAYHETAATITPIAEYGRGQGHIYGKPVGIYNNCYYGRGFVQLTWNYNYQKFCNLLRSDGSLSENKEGDIYRFPDLALRPDIAAKILVLGMRDGEFTGRKLSDYFIPPKNDTMDYAGARHIINGSDRAMLIANYARLFAKALGL